MTDTATDTGPLRKERDGRILVLTVANPPVNALSYPVRTGLIEAIDQACKDPGVDAIILRCEGRSFISGADIKEFSNPRDPRVPELVEFVERSTKPIVAALHGTALGGGLEISMACHYRVARPDVTMGLPEVNIGLLPGAGGTQRLPRLIGIPRALDVIVGGATLDAREALACGLIDQVSTGDLRADAIAFSRRLVEEGRGPRRTSERQVAPVDPALFDRLRELARRRQPGYLAPLNCIEAVEACALPFEQGLQREKRLFFQLFGSEQAIAMQYAFFAQREVGRLPAGAPGSAPGHAIVLVGEGVEADRLAAVLGAKPGMLTRLSAEALKARPLSEAHARQIASAAWVIEACPDASTDRGALLEAVVDAGARSVSTTAPLNDLPQLASRWGERAILSGVRASPLSASKLVETFPGPGGPATLQPVHESLRAAGATPMVLENQTEPLQPRLLEPARALLDRIGEAGTARAAIAGALKAYGMQPDVFGLHMPDAEVGSSEDCQAVIDALIGAIADHALTLVATGRLSAVQIDAAWTLGLGFPAYSAGPCRMIDTVGRQVIAVSAQAAARRLGVSLLLPSLATNDFS